MLSVKGSLWHFEVWCNLLEIVSDLALRISDLNKLHINVIDAGHMAADSIGANLYLDELEKKGIVVIPCSGLIRIKRKRS